jgi:hypothetical protein
MARPLVWIAAGGLGAGAVFLSLAYATGGHDLGRLFDHGLLLARSCGDGAAPGTQTSERRFSWTGGDTVDIAGSANVRYRGGEGSEVVVRGAPDAIAHVDIKGGHIAFDCHGFAGPHAVEITLPGRAFRRVRLSGSGRLVMENLEQPELAVRISGSGDLRAQGAVDHVTIRMAGSGNARLAALAVKQLTVDIAGSGNLEAAPLEEADVKIAGSGDVRLLSRPTRLRSKVSGSGRVSQVASDSAAGDGRR